MSIDEQPMNVYWSGQKSPTSNKYKINYKGTIATASALPAIGNKKGDTYNISEDGSDYIWTGSEWDKLGSNVYVGATNSENGIQGLVPPASSSQTSSLLTGGGTWESVEDLGLALDATGSVQRTLSEHFADIVNVKDFGAKGDGVTDDRAAIQAAINQANTLQKPVVFDHGKSYKILGSGDLTFTYGAEFNGSTLDVSGMTGFLYFNSPGDGWVEDNDALAALKSGENILAQSSLVPGWSEYYGVSNHYVNIQSSQYYYTYRNSDITRFEYNLITDRGQTLSPFKYTLDVSTVTSVKKMAFNRKATTYSNVIIKIGSRNPNNEDWFGVVNTFNSSNVKINNLSFDFDNGKDFLSDDGFALYYTSFCGHIQIDGLYCLAPIYKQNGRASYCLKIADCYDVKIKNAIGQGAGWGSTGDNRVWRVVFEDCDLSRIDFHNPFFEYLKIKNCNIGRDCITTTGIGDLFVEDTTFKLEPSSLEESASSAVIKGRTETNGICDGSAYLRNCKVIVNTVQDVHLFENYTSDTDVLKSGSPIEAFFWREIFVDTLKVVGSAGLNLSPSISANSYGPTRIAYNNIYGECRYVTNFNEGKSEFDHDTTNIQHLLQVSNAEIGEFEVAYNISSPYRGMKKIVLENIHKLDTGGCSFRFRGHYDVSIANSDVRKIYSISTNKGNGRSIVVDNCRINTTGESAPFAFRSDTERVLFKNCTFIEQPIVSMFTQQVTGLDSEDLFTGLFQHILFSNNRVLNKASGAYLYEIEFYEFDNTPSTSVSIDITGAYKNGHANWFNVECGTDSDRVFNVTFKIPSNLTSNRYYYGDGNYITIGRASGNNLVITSSDAGIAIRRVSIVI